MARVETGDLVADPGAPLGQRYAAGAFAVFDAQERDRFLRADGTPRHPGSIPWELLYRLEPALYHRLVAGETLHQGILNWLPVGCERVLEVGAGTGRLTLDLAVRFESVTAVEPAGPLRELLEARLDAAGLDNVEVVPGHFDELPPGAAADLVISCSAFNPLSVDDPEACLAAMEAACAPGGTVGFVWPAGVAWLTQHGYAHETFAGPMLVEYASAEDAAQMARIFYPHALDAVLAAGSRFIDPVTLGFNPPRDVCWRRVGAAGRPRAEA